MIFLVLLPAMLEPRTASRHNTGTSVVRCLQTAHDKARITPVDQRAITPEQWAQLDLANPASLFSRVLKEVSEADRAKAAQKPLVNQESIIAARLTMFVSHFHQALDNGITRGTFAAGSRSYYKRDVDATGIPDLSSYGAVKTAARHIVKGEAERALAETNGWTRFDTGESFDRGASFDGTPPAVKPHVPMSNPSAAEVSGLLALFEEVSNRLSTAKTRTNKEQEDWDALYPLPKQSKPTIGRPTPVTAARPKLANITSNSPAGTATVTAPLLPKANAPAALRLEKQQKKKYLDRLRQQSAYPELRTTVVILKILGYAAAAVLFLMSLALGRSKNSLMPSRPAVAGAGLRPTRCLRPARRPSWWRATRRAWMLWRPATTCCDWTSARIGSRR